MSTGREALDQGRERLLGLVDFLHRELQLLGFDDGLQLQRFFMFFCNSKFLLLVKRYARIESVSTLVLSSSTTLRAA